MEERPRNIKMFGASHLQGGAYEEINIAGSARFDGDITSTSLSVSGGASIGGNASTGACRIAGSAHIHGNLNASDVHISGSCQVDGDLLATDAVKVSGGARVGGDLSSSGEVKVSGSTNISGMLRAQNAKLSGSATIEKGVECETLVTSGGFTIGGLINVGTLDITLGGDCKADEIGGETVTVKLPAETNLNIFGFTLKLGVGVGTLIAETIEASNVTLVNTTAAMVRGDKVEIGAGCNIQCVEYRGELTISPESTVVEQIKLD